MYLILRRDGVVNALSIIHMVKPVVIVTRMWAEKLQHLIDTVVKRVGPAAAGLFPHLSGPNHVRH